MKKWNFIEPNKQLQVRYANNGLVKTFPEKTQWDKPKLEKNTTHTNTKPITHSYSKRKNTNTQIAGVMPSPTNQTEKHYRGIHNRHTFIVFGKTGFLLESLITNVEVANPSILNFKKKIHQNQV